MALVCPRCGSKQVTGGKQGYGYGKGCLGGCLLGPLGLLAGGLGSNKVVSRCLACGNSWEPSIETSKHTTDHDQIEESPERENEFFINNDYDMVEDLLPDLEWVVSTPYRSYALAKHNDKFDIVKLGGLEPQVVSEEEIENLPELQKWMKEYLERNT